MVTNIQEGNIYKRLTTNIQTGKKLFLTYKVVRLNMTGDEEIESLTIRDAISDFDSQISLDEAMIQSESIELSPILFFYLGFEQILDGLPGVDINSYYELILSTHNIILVEEETHYALVEYDHENNEYQIATRLSSLDALQNYLYLHNHIRYSPNVNTVNHALLCQDDVIRWTMLVKDRIEREGPLLDRGVFRFLSSIDNKCSRSDVNVVMKYGISRNYFIQNLTFDGILYTTI